MTYMGRAVPSACTSGTCAGIGSATDGSCHAEALRPRVVEAGQLLFRQGDPCQGIYSIQSGLVGMRRADADGNSALLSLQMKGDVIGYRALLSRAPHASTAEALTTTRVCFVEASRIAAAMDRNPAVKDVFLHRALDELDRTEAKCASLLTVDLKARLLQLLHQLSESLGCKSEGASRVLDLPIQRKDIAALIGATPESISRVIARLRSEGLVSFDGRKVTIWQAAEQEVLRAAGGARSAEAEAELAISTLMDARRALLSMIEARERVVRDSLHEQVRSASGRLDRLLEQASGGGDRVARFRSVWEQFKATRQGEIIPAIYAGEIERARRVATGIQAERLARMRAYLGAGSLHTPVRACA